MKFEVLLTVSSEGEGWTIKSFRVKLKLARVLSSTEAL